MNVRLDVPCKANKIKEAIDFTLEHKDELIVDTPYYKENSAELYYRTTMKILQERVSKYKVFYDIKPLKS